MGHYFLDTQYDTDNYFRHGIKPPSVSANKILFYLRYYDPRGDLHRNRPQNRLEKFNNYNTPMCLESQREFFLTALMESIVKCLNTVFKIPYDKEVFSNLIWT